MLRVAGMSQKQAKSPGSHQSTSKLSRAASGGKGKSLAASPSKSRSSTKKPTQKKTTRRGSSRVPQRTIPAVTGIKVKPRSRRKKKTTGAANQSTWGRLHSQLPPYADEMFGFLLIGLGLLSFLTLLSPESGEIGTAWSGLLRRWFGLGAYVISGVIVAAGAVLLMPKVGVSMRINLWRVTVGEVFFVLLLALIHTSIRARFEDVEAGRIEAFARAMEGHGGGLVGWAIQDAVHMLFGDVITGMILSLLLAGSGAVLAGVRRRHLVAGLAKLRDWLLALADRLEPNPLPPPEPAPAVEAEEDDPNKPAIVQLPPIPGRPSIVTGQRGAGAVFVQRRRPNPAEEDLLDLADRPVTRLERLKARLPRGYKVPMRFHLDEVVDSKHTRKRSDKLPPLDIFDARSFERPDDEEINISAALIEETVADFGMSVEVVGVKAGPTVTQYAVSPITHVEVDGELVEQRVRVTRIANLGKDIALALAAPSVRIQAPVPGTSYIGIEVPNSQMGVVSLRPVMESEEFNKIRSPLAVALGREVDGKPYAADLAKMPHLLIGGTTGSGKSVCLRSLATCLVANNRPDQLRLIMIDPKMVELIRFNGLPHLLGRVEVELDRVLGVLRWVTREMDRRYKLMEENHSRNLEIYNRKVHWTKRMPYIVVLIDELAELMTQYPEETEHLITRLAQMARATGIHLVVATQRPSTDVVTGLIKANFPARIAFAVASGTDSRVILDHVGAEELIGKGDMLYQAPEAAAPVRLQGCYVSDVEMERLVDYWRENWEDSDDRVAPWERALSRRLILQETDELIEEAIRVVQQEREASASQLQRKLNVGYPRAGRIIDSLYRLGVVGPERGGGRTREVLIPPDEDPIEFILKRQGKL